VQYGALVISLDFELLWGVRDKRTIADYGPNILGVRQAVPALLDLFAEREIACTWATVGLLFFATNKALHAGLPARKPRYSDARISSYHYLNEVGADEERDPYHYGLSLIRQILNCPRQEIGTHTFSHFYCLERGGRRRGFSRGSRGCAIRCRHAGHYARQHRLSTQPSCFDASVSLSRNSACGLSGKRARLVPSGPQRGRANASRPCVALA